MARKTLKDRAEFKNIFINDDLTTLRARLMKYIKSSGKFGPVWTVDGKIYCGKKIPPGAQPDRSVKPLIVETPDDLFKAGFSSVDYEQLGLVDWSTVDLDTKRD